MNELLLALDELEKTKSISKDYMIEAIKAAIAAACKKNFTDNLYVRVDFDEETGAIGAFTQKMVCETVEDPQNEILLQEARAIRPDYAVGDFVDFPVDPRRFGRIAAQTAKQVVIQKIREAERGHLFDTFTEKEGKILSGVIQTADRKGIIVSLEDNAEGILPMGERIPGEEYPYNRRMKFFVLEIKNIVREAGSRTKMAVYSNDEAVDPIGACVGQKGMRVNAVMEGMEGEKVDIINYSDDSARYIAAALSPAKVSSVVVNEEDKTARVTVPEYQLSLAIGKEGQNARMAARLTGFKIDIKSVRMRGADARFRR